MKHDILNSFQDFKKRICLNNEFYCNPLEYEYVVGAQLVCEYVLFIRKKAK